MFGPQHMEEMENVKHCMTAIKHMKLGKTSMQKYAGNIPQIFPMRVQCMSNALRTHLKQIRWKHARNMSAVCPSKSRTCPTPARDMSKICSKHFLNRPATCPTHVEQMSITCPKHVRQLANILSQPSHDDLWAPITVHENQWQIYGTKTLSCIPWTSNGIQNNP